MTEKNPEQQHDQPADDKSWLDILEWISFHVPEVSAGEIAGFLDTFSETGDGIHWCVQEPGQGMKGIHLLEDGDVLTVFDQTGQQIWKGTIDLEYESGLTVSPINPYFSQQAVFNLWANGCQRGMDMEQWSQMFFGPRAPGKEHTYASYRDRLLAYVHDLPRAPDKERTYASRLRAHLKPLARK